MGAGSPYPAPHCGEPCTEICWEGSPEAAQAVAGSWGHCGLLSYCSNNPQLSVRAVQMSRQHRKAPTSCQQTPLPCLGGTSIMGTQACDPPASPQRDTAERSRMDTSMASPPASHTSLRFTPQLSLKAAGKGLENTVCLRL